MTRVIDDPLYGVWEAMKQRCCNPKNHKYKNYGQRGITVSDLWKRSFKDFKKWAEKSKFSYTTVLQRINLYHMKPEDAISVPDKHMILVTINGVTKNLTEWSKVYGVSMSTASARIARGWNPIKAVTTPARKFRHAN